MSNVTPVKHNDEWATPTDLFGDLYREFKFTVDAAASPKNHKHPRYWGQGGEFDDGLSADWAKERVFVNPPWSNVAPWVEKALQREADVVVLLLPSRTDRKWFHDLNDNPWTEIRFFRGRVAFIDPEPPLGKKPRTSPREGALVAIVRGRGPLATEATLP